MFAGASVALTFEIGAFEQRAARVAARAPDLIPRATSDAARAMRALIAHLDDSTLDVWAVDDRARAVIVRDPSGKYVARLPRTETEFVPRPLSRRISVAIGTAFGLRLQRVSVGDLLVYVKADDRAFEEQLISLAIGSGCALMLALVIAVIVARALAAQALRPLNEVVVALEQLAAGDLLPRAVDHARGDAEFQRLSTAFNGAIAQVQAALHERDLAERATRRFIADAVHQLRTPLTVTSAFATMLGNDHVTSDGDRVRIVANIQKQCRLMAALISNLTLLERWEDEKLALESIDLAEFVRDVALPYVASHPERNFTLATEVAGEIVCDVREVSQALENVIDNAVKYADPAAIAISCAASGPEAAITVRDCGRGMSEREVRHAFDRFFRGDDRAIVGSGLGLAIAHRALERAGGRIELASEPGSGTTVTLVFPRMPSAIS